MLKKLVQKEKKKMEFKKQFEQETEEFLVKNIQQENEIYIQPVENLSQNTKKQNKSKHVWHLFHIKEKKLQKSQEKLQKRHRFQHMVRILILSRKIAQQMNLDLQHHRKKIKKDPIKGITKCVIKILYISQDKDVKKMAEKIKEEVISIANLMDCHQALCMTVLISQIRTNSAIDPSVAMYLEKIAKSEFAINDGTHDKSLKNHSLEFFDRDIHSEGVSL